MTIRRNIGFGLILMGLLVALMAAMAEYLGLGLTHGVWGYAEFGWVQITGVITGVSVSVIGAILTYRSEKKPEVLFED
jgi:hypothetical protein